MRALVYDPTAPRGLRHADVADPIPQAGQALVEIQAISLNFGELTHIASMRQR